MKIISPYGKNILKELPTVYKLNSIEELVSTINYHLAKYYSIHSCEVISVHVAYGLTLKISVSESIYYLKFASRSMNRTPEDLFSYIDFLSCNSIPVPKIFKTNDGNWFIEIIISYI